MNEEKDINEIDEGARALDPASDAPETASAAPAEAESQAEEAAEAKGKKKKKKEAEKTDAFDLVQCVVTALLVCILLFVFAGRIVNVIGPSMESTLFEGDRLIISRLFYTPKQGDIVVLRKDSFKDEAIIKRVIAVGGQTVDIDFDKGIVYVDGEALDEDYINEPTLRPLDFDDEVTVPEGSVFVLGDNRNKSNDSRDERIGCVDTRYILGRAIWRVTPFEKFGSLYD